MAGAGDVDEHPLTLSANSKIMLALGRNSFFMVVFLLKFLQVCFHYSQLLLRLSRPGVSGQQFALCSDSVPCILGIISGSFFTYTGIVRFH